MVTFTNSSSGTRLSGNHKLVNFKFMIPSNTTSGSGKSVSFSDLVAKPAFYQDPDGSPQNYYQLRSNIYNGVYRQGTGASASIWSVQANNNDNLPIFQAYTGRNRGTSGSTYAPPVIQQLQDSNLNVKLSDYVGMTPMGLAQDDCDLYSNNLNGRMANYSSSFVSGQNLYQWYIQTAPYAGNRIMYAFGMNGAAVSQNGAHADKRPQASGAYSKNTQITFDDNTVGMGKTGIQYVVMKSVTNHWAEIYLNNILAPGDRVVVLAVSSGGTMYTHTGVPIYLRTVGGSSISGDSVTTHLAPRKNETGNDTWAAVYSVVNTNGGAARIGLNPYHSASQNFTLYGIFVIKGPRTTVTYAAATKYTGGTTGNNAFATISPTNNDIRPGTWREQGWQLVTSMSPFGNNGGTGYTNVNNNGTFSSTAYEDYRWMAAGTTSQQNIGAWSGSWADDTSYRYLMSLGKSGSAWVQGGYGTSGMQFQHLRQDFELFSVGGSRGHTDFN